MPEEIDSRLLFDQGEDLVLDDLGCGDSRNDVTYYIFKRNVKGKGSVTFVLNSERQLSHVVEVRGEQSVLSDGSVIRNLSVPEFRSWSDDGIRTFLDGSKKIKSLAEIFELVKGVLSRTIYATLLEIETMALIAIASFFSPSPNALPLCHIRGPWGAGKTHAATTLLRLCFNSSKGDEVAVFGKASPASIFRSMAQSRGAVVIDDIETLNNTKSTPLRVGMLVAYKKQTAIQTLAENSKPKNYNLFQIKILSSINPAEPILRSRILELFLLRAPKGYIPKKVSEQEFSEIRDSLHLASMSKEIRGQLHSALQVAEEDKKFSGRYGEITAILRALSVLCRPVHPQLFNPNLSLDESTGPDIGAEVEHLLKEGFKGVTVVHLQSVLLLKGFFVPTISLGKQLASIVGLKAEGQLSLHGIRSQVYVPIGKTTKDLKLKMKVEPRNWCLQGSRKKFDDSRCGVCPFLRVCPVRKAQEVDSHV